jgi:chemotaxis response regulator CheB
MDIEMPEMDGLEALKKIRRELPQIGVVMISGLTNGRCADHLALEMGALDFIAKPTAWSASQRRAIDQPGRRLINSFMGRGFFTAARTSLPSRNARAAAARCAKTGADLHLAPPRAPSMCWPSALPRAVRTPEPDHSRLRASARARSAGAAHAAVVYRVFAASWIKNRP